MKKAVKEKDIETAMDQFFLNLARKHKKIDEDGHYSSSVSSDFDIDAYNLEF